MGRGEKKKSSWIKEDFFRVHQPGTRLGTAVTLTGRAFGGLAQSHTNWVSGLVVMEEDGNEPSTKLRGLRAREIFYVRLSIRWSLKFRLKISFSFFQRYFITISVFGFQIFSRHVSPYSQLIRRSQFSETLDALDSLSTRIWFSWVISQRVLLHNFSDDYLRIKYFRKREINSQREENILRPYIFQFKEFPSVRAKENNWFKENKFCFERTRSTTDSDTFDADSVCVTRRLK